MATATAARELRCVVVTPEKAFFDEPVDFVALPMFDGELGVLPGRAPLIGRLGYGELRVRQAGRLRRFFIDGGFAQVRANVVSVLTPRALRAEDINPSAVAASLTAAPPAATAAAREAQARAQDRARAQLRIARHQQEDRG